MFAERETPEDPQGLATELRKCPPPMPKGGHRATQSKEKGAPGTPGNAIPGLHLEEGQ